MSSLEEALKIVNAKFCAFHSCTNNSYRCSDVQFFAFPRACSRVACNFVEAKAQHIRGCSKCQRCLRWSIGSKVSAGLGFKAHRLYICGEHFIKGHPSNKYPDPMSVEMIKRIKNLETVENLTTKNLDFLKDCSILTTKDSPSLNSKLATLHDFRDVLSATNTLLDETYSRVLTQAKRSQAAINHRKFVQNNSYESNNRTEEMEMMDKLHILKSTITELDSRLMTSFVITCEDKAVFKETNLLQATKLKIENKRLKDQKSNLQNQIVELENFLDVQENAIEDKEANAQTVPAVNNFPTILLIVDDDN